MKNIESKLLQLKDKLESTAFLVSKNGTEKQVHSEIVQSLVILSGVLQEIGKNSIDEEEVEPNSDKEVEEIIKVRSRLGLWAKRQNNINSRILSRGSSILVK